nr:MAG TPA: hypothetical protein [Caudoviricetes sp.]
MKAIINIYEPILITAKPKCDLNEKKRRGLTPPLFQVTQFLP